MHITNVMRAASLSLLLLIASTVVAQWYPEIRGQDYYAPRGGEDGECVKKTAGIVGWGSCAEGGSGDLTAVSAGAGISVANGTGPIPTVTTILTVNTQSGTTYTVQATDHAKLVRFTNGSAIAVTLPQATSSFGAGFFFYAVADGAGTATITPTTSTIGGSGSLALDTEEAALIISDGTNYHVIVVRTGGGGGSIPSGVEGQITGYDSGNTLTSIGLTGDDETCIILDKTTDPANWKIEPNADCLAKLTATNSWTAPQAYTASTTQNLDADGDALDPNGPKVNFTLDTSRTLTSTPTILNPSVDGTTVTFCNIDSTDTLTLQADSLLSGSDLELRGSSTYAMPPKRCDDFIWDASADLMICKTCSSSTLLSAGAGIGSFYPFGLGGTTTAVASQAALVQRCWEVMLPAMEVAALHVRVATAASNGTNGAAWALYNASTLALVGQTSGLISLNSAGGRRFVFSATLLVGGTYYACSATEDTSMEYMAAGPGPTVSDDLLNADSSNPRIFSMSSAANATGTGTGITFPATLNTGGATKSASAVGTVSLGFMR